MVKPKAEFIAKLPAGYDDRTRLAYDKALRTILLIHPDFPPGVLKGGRVAGLPGEAEF